MPFRLLKLFHKIQQRLVRELEKKFSGKDVVLVANRRIMPPPTSGKSNARPRSRTLTAVSGGFGERGREGQHVMARGWGRGVTGYSGSSSRWWMAGMVGMCRMQRQQQLWWQLRNRVQQLSGRLDSLAWCTGQMLGSAQDSRS